MAQSNQSGGEFLDVFKNHSFGRKMTWNADFAMSNLVQKYQKQLNQK